MPDKAEVPDDIKITITGFKVLDSLFKLLEKFGWPLILIGVMGGSIEKWGTPQQKSEIIGTLFLGHGISPFWATLTVLAVAMFAIWRQQRYYKGEVEARDREINRIGGEKSQLQELLAGRLLPHTKTKR